MEMHWAFAAGWSGAGIDVSVSVLDSFFIATFASARRLAERV
jgi:hypothetical protein